MNREDSIKITTLKCVSLEQIPEGHLIELVISESQSFPGEVTEESLKETAREYKGVNSKKKAIEDLIEILKTHLYSS